jgi:hypothetical protein
MQPTRTTADQQREEHEVAEDARRELLELALTLDRVDPFRDACLDLAEALSLHLVSSVGSSPH